MFCTPVCDIYTWLGMPSRYVVSNQGIEQDVTRCGTLIIDLSPKVCYFINVVSFQSVHHCAFTDYL